MSALAPWQRTLADVYGGGDYAHITDTIEAEGCGNGLFSFLMIETSPFEDCDSKQEALRRIQTAIEELTDCRDMLENQEGRS